MKAQKVTAHRTLEGLVAEERFASQIELVREHWTAVQHLWLDASDLPAACKLRADFPEGFYIGAGMPGLATIRPTRDGRFEFAEDGQPAIIIPAYDTIPGNLDANAERHVEHLVDLVAVDFDQPDRCWRRRGEALVLGAAYLDIAGHEGAPITVFTHPLNWLMSGGAGIAILDWSWVPELLLGHGLIAEDIALGERLDAALKPDIWIGRTAA